MVNWLISKFRKPKQEKYVTDFVLFGDSVAVVSMTEDEFVASKNCGCYLENGCAYVDGEHCDLSECMILENHIRDKINSMELF